MKLTQEKFNEVMFKYEQSMTDYYSKLKAPKCHFKPMQYVAGEYGECWWECSHCGHTKEETSKRSEEY